MDISIPYYEDKTRISNSNIGWFLNKGPAYFRITDSDSLKAARLTEATVGIMTSQKIDAATIDNCHDSRVSSTARRVPKRLRVMGQM